MTAIGAATPSQSQSQSSLSRVALRADLAKVERQLSDCVNCSSAKTPEGKRNIQDLNAKMGDLKAKLNGPAESNPAASAANPTASAVGGRVDVYA